MPDVPIVNRATVAAPKNYQLPQGQEILLKAVHAEIDGSGAAGTFLPALQLISDAGDVMWTSQDPGLTVAAGGTASVTWFPGLSAQGFPVTPGSILSTFPAGNFTVGDFTTNSLTYVATGFPTNPTYTKASSASYLGIYGEADFTSGASPDVLYFAVFIDGTNVEATGIHISNAGSFATGVISTVKTPGPAWMNAGNHTVSVRTACNSGANFTMLTSSSVDLTLVEFVP